MSGYRAALHAEALKARRSMVPALTFAAVTAAGAVAGLFLLITIDPSRAERVGLLRQKAELTGITGDWTGLLAFVGQLVAVGDLLIFAFMLTWVFGRESVEGTLRYLLALPVSRSSLVWAKLTVVTVWALLAHLWLMAVTLLIGAALRLPGGTAHVLADGFARAGLAAVLMLVVALPVALVASAGRGYLAPLASALAALVLAQVAAALGWAAAFPWSVPAVAAGLVPGTSLGPVSVTVVALTGAAGVVGTMAWWRSGRADG
jgi:ABC-2 type transport system permease protein